ncbi:hypothetical protein L249_0665 [Ophiocordyceps polyrhachis-furcata BCC 54312]|uniref:Cerato-platanin n=1 Tax=Ophiocordyceps polyrhachis-furcata BCC 54312 TaxID=1330021 RepID=A0A367LE40_9HYPO|nr:hypothetical protein L249_0665 [Ophiocordyceps polyrhachis-furcata BCC 54312]
MHLLGLFSSLLLLLLLVASASATYVSYDPGYDDASRSLTRISCSDGPNGLITRYHWQTQGQIPGFPNIGGMQGVSYNSPQCGTCYRLSYGGRTIHVLAVDAAYNGGFNIGLGAMNVLTDGNAAQFGHVDADAQPAELSDCGIR